MMFNKEPIVAELPDRMNLNSTNYFSKSQMVSLLYHLGYLTIDTETSLKKRNNLLCYSKQSLRKTVFRLLPSGYGIQWRCLQRSVLHV